jgi:hypothetical protein
LFIRQLWRSRALRGVLNGNGANAPVQVEVKRCVFVELARFGNG